MSNESRRGRFFRPRIILTLIGLLVLIGAAAWYTLRGTTTIPTITYSLITPGYGELVATVNATGQIEPARVINLSFGASGRVAEVFVKVGDSVASGDVLARLDARDLELRVRQSEAALGQAQAAYTKLTEGPTKAELAAAEAQLQQAQGQLRQVLGSVTDADAQAARAQLQQANAVLSRLQSGPEDSDVQAAQGQLQQAQVNLESQRDQLSTAKTNAGLQLEQATNGLTQAQARYSTALQNWQYVQDTGGDPIVRRVSDPTRPGQTKLNKLNDSQRQQYYDVFIQTEAALRSAETTVVQAQVNYENARQAEIHGLQTAEGQVAATRAKLNQVLAGADVDQLAAARTQVASARASIEKLGGDQREGSLEAAQAGVAAAQANLDRLRDGATKSDLEAAESQIRSAQAGLDVSRLALDEATLRAPFNGVIAEVNLKVGETPRPALPALVLADLSSFYVDVAVDEIDVSRVVAGQVVTLTLDALPGLQVPGTVQSIAPLATAQSAVASYLVRVTTTAADARVRAGMSVGADIVVARQENALLVPRRAVRTDRRRLVVDVLKDAGLCGKPQEQRPPKPELEQREVTTGLSNEQMIEITSGVDTNACVYVEGLDTRFNPLNGPPGRR